MTPESNSILIACVMPRAVYESMLAAGLELAVIGPQPGIASEQRGTNDKPALVAVEAAGLVAMEMLEQDGILTIGAVAMPGSAPALRLMMYPDGHKLGVERIAASVENGIARLSEVLDDVDEARAQLLGE